MTAAVKLPPPLSVMTGAALTTSPGLKVRLPAVIVAPAAVVLAVKVKRTTVLPPMDTG